MHLYRIAQEAVANAVRHGKAKHVVIRLNSKRTELEMSIKDDGIGMAHAGSKQTMGMGLRTMRYRAQALGAQLEIQSQPGAGTTVICNAPVQSLTPL